MASSPGTRCAGSKIRRDRGVTRLKTRQPPFALVDLAGATPAASERWLCLLAEGRHPRKDGSDICGRRLDRGE